MYNRRLFRLGFFQLEDVGNILLRNADTQLPDYGVERPRLHEHEASQFWEPQIVYGVSPEERSIFWEVTVSVILSKKVYMYTCPIPNGFRDRAISLYSSKTVDKKEILRKK
jgi:hypothetical protein